MRFVKQLDELPVQNMDLVNSGKEQRRKHSFLLPNTIRGIVVGPSNCGKTNVMLTLIEHSNGLKFENLYIYSKSLHQPKYQYLKKVLTSIKGMGYYSYTDNSEICPVDTVRKNSIFIFDDIACDKQDNIRAYFCMGRHSGIDCFYLCQTYTRIPKHLIRDNANFIIAFKQDDLNLKHIYNDHVNTDMSFEQFKQLCAHCWTKDKYGFVTIDKDSSIENGRYRQRFDTYIKF